MDFKNIESPNLLLVEGKDEEFFFGALICYMGLKNIQIINIEGKDNLRRKLRALINDARFHEVVSIGIVRDANDDPRAAFQSICDALKAVNLSVPERPLVSNGVSPKVTIMILPKEDTPGMLEDICLKSIENDPVMFCIDQYFKCLEERRIPIPKKRSKAKVQAFLASRTDPGKRLGKAAQAGYWPWDNIAFDPLKNFLQTLTV